MSTNIQTWYDFVLQQMAAESYLNGWNNLLHEEKVARLNLGSNNPDYLQNGQTSTTPILPGATRMTATQAADFTTRYRVVDHRGNDDARFANLGVNADGVNVLVGNGSGLSATLMEKLDANGNRTGEFTLSIRSTEYFNPSTVRMS